MYGIEGLTEELLCKYQESRAKEFKLALKYPEKYGTPQDMFDEIYWVLHMPYLNYTVHYLERLVHSWLVENHDI